MTRFKKIKQYHFDVFSRTNLMGYLLVAVLSFVFIKIDFNNKSYMLNASSVCAADLVYGIKDNVLFITMITAALMYITFKNFGDRFSYNVVIRYDGRKHLYKSQLVSMIFRSMFDSFYVIVILFGEAFFFTRKILNWNVENSYYGFMNGQTYHYSVTMFCILLILYIFSFVCSQMLMGLYLRWLNINSSYMFFFLVIFAGGILVTNRMVLPDDAGYGFSALNTLPPIAFFIVVLAVSWIIMRKIVPKREFLS